MNNKLPFYIKDMFKLRDNVKNVRGTNKLVLPHVSTSRYGLKTKFIRRSYAVLSLRQMQFKQ